MKKMKTVED